MSSKINGIEPRPVQVSSGSAARPVAGRAADESGVPAAKPDVHITDAARTLASLEQAIKDMPEVDEKKVSLVRDALRDGNYKIDSQRTADKFLRMEQELSGGKRNDR